jgi:hypothetical protein
MIDIHSIIRYRCSAKNKLINMISDGLLLDDLQESLAEPVELRD